MYASDYWKEECFGLDAITLIDKAIALDYIGGAWGGFYKPTPFMCLVLKLLQIQPDLDVIEEYVNAGNK